MTTVNITVTNDAHFNRSFQYVFVGGAPIDITGGTMEMMLRRHAADATAVMRLGTDTGEITILDSVNGLFAVEILQPDLERLGLGDFDHSNILTLNSANIKIWDGTFTNNPGATR